MDDLFAPPGTEWRPVSPQLRRMRRTLLLAFGGLVLVGAAVPLVALGLASPWLYLGLVVLLPLVVLGWWLIGRNARLWGYAERDADLYIRHGAMFREMIAVPYGRMQYVDVTSGPLEQLYGIATVNLHTASARTNATIPGLTADEAARLRDRLTELGETQAAGL